MSEALLKKLQKCIKQGGEISTIYGDLKIGKQLGQGGTSLVQQATLQQREFAIKFLLENIAEKEPTPFKRFKQAHLNLLELSDSRRVLPQYHMETIFLDKDTKLPFIIMPIAQETLKSYVANLENRDFNTFKYIFDELLECLEVIHSKKIIHRDLKPENIFFYNNRFVLGDFDIAKFDDPEAIRLNHTEQRDRLANYFFSAPEQSQKQFVEITAAADLYAFGQIMYWYLKKRTLRGLSPLHYSEFENEYKPYLFILRKLLSDSPENRFSSSSEVRDALKNKLKQLTKDHDWESIHAVCDFEDDIVRKYGSQFGKNAFVREIPLSMINEIMQDLSSEPTRYQLWWQMGHSDLQITRIELIEDNKWLLDYIELNITNLWLYRGIHGPGTSFIAIEFKSDKPSGLYPDPAECETEEYALNGDGTLITRSEYDNGYFERESKVFQTENPQLRVRYLKESIIFIAPHSGPLFENKLALHSLYENYNAGTMSEEFFSKLGTINRTDVIKKFD